MVYTLIALTAPDEFNTLATDQNWMLTISAMATEKQHAPVRTLCRFTLGSQPERHQDEPEELSRRDHELHQLAGLPHPPDREDHHSDADEEAAGAG